MSAQQDLGSNYRMSELPKNVVSGHHADARASWDTLMNMPVDEERIEEDPLPLRTRRRTVAKAVTVQGPGTFFGKETRTIEILPTEREGWWFDRADLPDSLRIGVGIHNVWTTGAIVSNIVLRSGSPHNYVRLVEHIIALRMGMEIDDVVIRIDSGDPPLFDVGSMPLVEAMEEAGMQESDYPMRYVTVKEPVAFSQDGGKLLVFEPAEASNPRLELDVGIDFPTAIGQQRIRFVLNRSSFRHGAHARTNTSFQKKLYCQTVGKVFADVRNLGYTNQNVLVAGKHKYHNVPGLMHEGKSLEASWHRAVLDLLAAVALIDRGHFLGKISSYKAGHGMDVDAVNQLYRNDLLTSFSV